MSGTSLLRISNQVTGLRFVYDYSGYVHRPVTRDQARARIAERLRNREQIFLEKLRNEVFENPTSLYLPLLRQAGCEAGDIAKSVARDGIEATLHLLFRNGVYLTSAEFKGRSPLRRGGLEMQGGPEMLRPRHAAYHLSIASSGSRGEPTPVLMDLRFLSACAGAWLVMLDAWGERDDWAMSVWETPGAGARFRLMKLAGAGHRAEAWFSQVDPSLSTLPWIVRWNTRMLRWSGWIARSPVPAPAFAPLQRPSTIAEWFGRMVQQRRTPYVQTFASSAVALCRYAMENGINIAGGRILMMGEPITGARMETVRAAGCVGIPRYGTIETGPIGYGCPHGDAPDDVHFLSDHHALIQAGPEGKAAGLPEGAVFLTSLLPQAPFTMLNVSMGDQAVISRRQCSCEFQKLGWTTRLSQIRSFEKLTSAGVTFLGTEIIRVLEEVLPARFGGAPTDFQLAEGETADGRALLSLIVNPSLGELNEKEVVDVFLTAVSSGSSVDAVASQIWRNGETLRVERRFPEVGRSGKILHFSSVPVNRGQ